MNARRATTLVALLAALLSPTAALADGDPASDVLLTQDYYAPYFPAPKKELVAELKAKLLEVRKAGYPMKVAMIQTPGDLGAYPELLGKLDKYAKLLESEIVFKVKQPHLVVVMPQGLAGRNLGKGADVLHDIDVDKAKQSDGLIEAALSSIDRVAEANGIKLESSQDDDGGDDNTLLYVLAGLIVVLGVALIVVSVRLRRSSEHIAGEADDDDDGAGAGEDGDESG